MQSLVLERKLLLMNLIVEEREFLWMQSLVEEWKLLPVNFLADILHRPGDAPSGGWPSKREEIDFHFTQAVRNALKIASISGETERPFTAEDIDRIIDGGHKGYLEYREGRQS